VLLAVLDRSLRLLYPFAVVVTPCSRGALGITVGLFKAGFSRFN
jgi:hypothetical protein